MIAQIIQEQKRARASQSELLHAQTAHIMRLSDQWPAFHALQVRVTYVAFFSRFFGVKGCNLKTVTMHRERGESGGNDESRLGKSSHSNVRKVLPGVMRPYYVLYSTLK